MPGPSGLPAVSIVVATYNRSRSLRCTLEAIRLQRLEDWEVIVVGDACTDDTEAVVRSFEDTRFRFVNLEYNTGEQAGPNNVGLALASASLVAFCNHDVLWLPEHLEVMRQTMLVEDADLTFGIEAAIGGDTPLPLDWATLELALIGAARRGRWTPALVEEGTVPASNMLFRTDALRRLRGWRRAIDCWSEPSQDLLFRAWRAGLRIRGCNRITVVTAPSGFRRGSYVGNRADEQEWLLGQLPDPALPSKLAAQALETNATFEARRGRRPALAVRGAALLLGHLGIDPRALWFRAVRGLRRGGYVEKLRQIRGLPRSIRTGPLLAGVRYDTVQRACAVTLDEEVGFAAGGDGARLLAFGWSRPDAEGVWNDGPEAELLVGITACPEEHEELAIDLWLRPFLGTGQAARAVEVRVGDQVVDHWDLNATDGWHRRIEVAMLDQMPGPIRLGFTFANTESPSQLGLSDDARQLAMGLLRLRVSLPGSGRAAC